MFSNVVRIVRFQTPPSFLFQRSSAARKACGVRFAQSVPDESHRMEDKRNQEATKPKTGDTMENSFGEGYSTRADEEGFGGIYGGNQSLGKKDEDDKPIHTNAPTEEHDHSQGSEVKEKERGRNQSHHPS